MSLNTFLTTALLLGSLLSNAAPITEDKRSISASQLSTLELMAQYAAAAYCSSNYASSPGAPIECAGGTCPEVQTADAVSTIEYSESNTSTDVTGFVAIDNTNKLIVVSFRGSTNIASWITDLDFVTTDTDICSACTAHEGFWNSWLDARNLVNPAVQQAASTYPDHQIVVVGHSLGAAIATLAAASLRNAGYTVALYNYGSPRVGGTAISSYITNQPGGNYRVTHMNDPVPKLPTLLMGFVHISPEYYIDKGDGETVAPADMYVYQGMANVLVGDEATLALDINAHQWYFAKIYSCDAASSKRDRLQIRHVEHDVEIFARF
ncbi:hypothetical protein ACEQ8H_002605 [Pleosporales sp. CAS-2024a]